MRRAVLMTRQASSPRLAINMRLNMRYLLATERRGPASQSRSAQDGTLQVLLHFCLIDKLKSGNRLAGRNHVIGESFMRRTIAALSASFVVLSTAAAFAENNTPHNLI